MSFLSTLSLILIVLKLTGVIHISWVVAFAPATLQVVLMFFAFICLVIAEVLK